MSTQTQFVTADELLRMPRGSVRRELVAGELREMTPAGHDHGFVTMTLAIPLGAFVRKNRLGRVYAAETGFLLKTNPDTVRAPDVAFVRRERVTTVTSKQGFFPGPPDLAVEVLSPNDKPNDVEEKLMDWLEAGCQMVVLINPRKRTLRVLRTKTDQVVLTDKDVFSASEVIPGFEIAVADIFED